MGVLVKMGNNITDMSREQKNAVKQSRMREMESKLNERQLKRYNDIPERYKFNYLKAVLGSRSCAVKAFCLECVQWDKKEVELCSSPACPLFNHRPYS